MARFILEGTWSGYTSSQQRVVHRSVHSERDKALREWLKTNSAIVYTDGTRLSLRTRECKPREKVKDLLNGYGSLINECVRHKVNSVSALPR